MILTFLVLTALGMLVGGRTLAQGGVEGWSEPLNLSRSGAASQPLLASAPDGTVQVLWWDRFDGIMTAIGDGATWSEPAEAPIFVTRAVGNEFELERLGSMPMLSADGQGRVHALWLGAADRETGARPLLYSRLFVGTTNWSSPVAVAESALTWHLAADPTGALHLIYVRTRHSALAPAGVYYRRSADGGASWSAAQALYTTIYFRLLEEGQAHVWVAGDGERVYATWDDPREEQVFLAVSPDGGRSWGQAQVLADSEFAVGQAWVIARWPGQTVLLWQAAGIAASCALYQQESVDGGVTWAPRQRVLEGLTTCPSAPRFLPLGEQGALLVGPASLAAFDGERWSEPRSLAFGFVDPERGRQVYLDNLSVALAGERIGVAGLGQDGEVWYLESALGALEWVYGPPPPWSTPQMVSQSGAWPGLPAMAADEAGTVHLLWSEGQRADAGTALVYARWDGERWTRPAEVLRSPEGGADSPSLALAGERLHAVWRSTGGEILYSRAYLRDAYAAAGWSEPRTLSGLGEIGSAPLIAADWGGALHVVYAVPVNEGRGIYHLRSDDGGETWLEAWPVADAAAAGWAMVDRPALAVDRWGGLHVAWVRLASPAGAAQGVYYAYSADGGATWGEPQEVALGAFDMVQLAVDSNGQLYLLWHEQDRGWWQQLRLVGVGDRTSPARVSGLEGIVGPLGLGVDESGSLHLVALGQDDVGEPALLYTTWKEGRWEPVERFRLGAGELDGPGVVLALQGRLGRLEAAFRWVAAGQERLGLWYGERRVAAVDVTPAATWTPRPTATVPPLPTATATPTPRPTVPGGAPLPAPPVVEAGPLSIPLLALGGIALAVAVVVAVMVLRARQSWR